MQVQFIAPVSLNTHFPVFWTQEVSFFLDYKIASVCFHVLLLLSNLHSVICVHEWNSNNLFIPLSKLITLHYHIILARLPSECCVYVVYACVDAINHNIVRGVHRNYLSRGLNPFSCSHNELIVCILASKSALLVVKFLLTVETWLF